MTDADVELGYLVRLRDQSDVSGCTSDSGCWTD